MWNLTTDWNGNAYNLWIFLSKTAQCWLEKVVLSCCEYTLNSCKIKKIIEHKLSISSLSRSIFDDCKIASLEFENHDFQRRWARTRNGLLQLRLSWRSFSTCNALCQLYSQLFGLYQCILKHRHAQITPAVSMYIETQTNTEITPGARCKERTER